MKKPVIIIGSILTIGGTGVPARVSHKHGGLCHQVLGEVLSCHPDQREKGLRGDASRRWAHREKVSNG